MSKQPSLSSKTLPEIADSASVGTTRHGLGFLDLPAELRLAVYRYTLMISRPLLLGSANAYTRFLWQWPYTLDDLDPRYTGRAINRRSMKILRLCRQVYEEASTVLFEEGRVVVAIPLGNALCHEPNRCVMLDSCAPFNQVIKSKNWINSMEGHVPASLLSKFRSFSFQIFSNDLVEFQDTIGTDRNVVADSVAEVTRYLKEASISHISIKFVCITPLSHISDLKIRYLARLFSGFHELRDVKHVDFLDFQFVSIVGGFPPTFGVDAQGLLARYGDGLAAEMKSPGILPQY